MGITRTRDQEKDKLTLINIDKQKAKEEQIHLQKHLAKKIQKTESTAQLKTELFNQIK